MKTQVAIIGGGPAGMLLSELLHQAGVASVVLERQSREHVLGRIRAGVLEPGTVDLLRGVGLGARLAREGHQHDGMRIVWAGTDGFFIDVWRHLGKRFTAYPQSHVQEDLMQAADRRQATVLFEVADIRLQGIDSPRPRVQFQHEDSDRMLDCDFIAGCDGFHGICRPSIPKGILREYDKIYPFGWLGILSDTPPMPDICYANHPRGFALGSRRSDTRSRYYIQVPLDTRIEDWPDDRFWTELKTRYPRDMADAIVTGPSIEKSIAPLRSFVAEPMQHGRLFLAGDAAHIVPPTGAKGLNLAVSDVHYLSRALAAFYASGDESALERYSQTALRRVWSAIRTSWYLTNLLHRFPGASDFDQRAQEMELAYLRGSEAAQLALAVEYAGVTL